MMGETTDPASADDFDAAEAFCPRFHYAVELVGRRWTGAILRALMHGATRFVQIRRAVPQLSDKMLASRLRELEEEGLVTRTVTPQTPVQIDYELTPMGRDLQEAVAAIGDWADKWLPPDTGDAPTTPPRPASGRRRP